MKILQRFQNRYPGIIVNASWYVTNDPVWTFADDFTTGVIRARDRVRAKYDVALTDIFVSDAQSSLFVYQFLIRGLL